MPLESQQGEIAERIRRFFRVRGRISSGVDELLVPVAQLVDLDRHPYTRFPTSAIAADQKSASVGNFQYFGVRAAAGDVAVVRGLLYSQGTTGRVDVRRRNVDITPAGYSFGNLDNIVNVELHRAASSGTMDWIGAGTPTGSTLVTQQRLLNDTTIWLPIQWVLYPGDSIFAGPHVVNISFEATWFYDVYPASDLSLQVAG